MRKNLLRAATFFIDPIQAVNISGSGDEGWYKRWSTSLGSWSYSTSVWDINAVSEAVVVGQTHIAVAGLACTPGHPYKLVIDSYESWDNSYLSEASGWIGWKNGSSPPTSTGTSDGTIALTTNEGGYVEQTMNFTPTSDTVSFNIVKIMGSTGGSRSTTQRIRALDIVSQ